MGTRYAAVADSAAILGALFYYDPTSEKCSGVIDWVGGCDPAAWEFGQPRAAAAIEAMRAALGQESPEQLHKAYNRLFIGPYALPAPPWGSVYTDPEGVLFGNLTLSVRQWMRTVGVDMRLPDKEPEDHFGLMLMMLSWGAAQVDDAALDQLVGEYLLPWAPRFLELFAAGADDAFYEGLAALAQATLSDWQARFALTVPEVRLAR